MVISFAILRCQWYQSMGRRKSIKRATVCSTRARFRPDSLSHTLPTALHCSSCAKTSSNSNRMFRACFSDFPCEFRADLNRSPISIRILSDRFNSSSKCFIRDLSCCSVSVNLCRSSSNSAI